MGPEELEAAAQGHLAVQVFAVADVPVGFGVEFVLDVLDQPVLGAYEVGLDVVIVPDSALGARGPVGAASDDDAFGLGDSDHFHGEFAGRVADFQCAVNVKTYQYRQTEFSFSILRSHHRDWNSSGVKLACRIMLRRVPTANSL